jgi:DNA-binding transcriptional regulator YiaG
MSTTGKQEVSGLLDEYDKEIIVEYVDEHYFDREKLEKYLSVHMIVGSEVFEYCMTDKMRSGYYKDSEWLNNDKAFRPLETSRFIMRIPFYFYIPRDEKIGSLRTLLTAADIGDPDFDPEYLYDMLEYMFYKQKLPLEVIFEYVIDQTQHVMQFDVFRQWNHYLHLCEDLGIQDPTPERFITRYNEVLEQCSLPPVIYEIKKLYTNDYYLRMGSRMKFGGIFPCDENGMPIMKWIGLRVSNAGNITCTCEKSGWGDLSVELKPDTVIDARNIDNKNQKDDIWYQIYVGPQKMEFDYEAIRSARIRLKYTQKQVAEAIGASVRTYQKWESGETMPDGYHLLRILNWLDLPDVQYVIKYTD